ncbi:hypothetical protein Tco_0377830 [Tanacetum coccineum]
MHNAECSSNAFVSRSNNDWFMNQNNQNRRYNRGSNTSLVSKHCNMTGHTIDRCFELVGYPHGFKRNPKVNNPKASVNNVSACNSGASSTYTLTNDEYKKLRNLLKSFGASTAYDIQGTYTCECQLCYLIGHPVDQALSVLKNKIELSDMSDSPYEVYRKAKQTIELFPLSDHKTTDLVGLYGLPSTVLSSWIPYELVYWSEPNLSHVRSFVCLCFASILINSDKFSEGSNEPYDEERDSSCKDDVTMPRSEAKSASTEGSANQNAEPTIVPEVAKDSGNHRVSTNGQSVQDTNIFSNIDNSHTLGSITAGDDLYPEIIVDEETLRRSSSYENYSFVTNLNKVVEPKAYKVASTDNRWIDAMNQEWKPKIEIIPGKFLLFQKEESILAASGFIRLNINPMVKLKYSRQDLWPKATVKRRALIMRKHFHQ